MPTVHVNDTMKNNKVSNLEVVSPKLAYNSFAKPSVGLTRKRSESSTGSGRFYRKVRKIVNFPLA